MGTNEGSVARKRLREGGRDGGMEGWKKEGISQKIATHHIRLTRQKLRLCLGQLCNKPLHMSTVPQKIMKRRLD